MEFGKILVANRGEIACRVLRTARALGYRTVAVFSDADARALHVDLADEAVRIGPPPARDSYLNMDALLKAAASTGAGAVHPGYGFLSENAAFARVCEQAGLVFIGPPAAAIEAMGNKAAAKRLMTRAGVPCVPGYEGEDQSDARFASEARKIGFPVMVKAAAGGGGRGMRRVERAEDLAAALTGARSEAANAFGSGELILEKAIETARHVEIQVFADAHGNTIHLGERDCSLQRRHQKVIEEAPSPAVSAGLRARMGETAVAAACAVAYRNAGTVEFLLDAAGRYYFLEMNTRLQVEHPVTEAVTGLDLVEWQLRIASGERLPLAQDEVRISGCAIEARLYAEDPARGFLPQSGTVYVWQPAERPGVRTDHGIKPGFAVGSDYDALLAKVVAHGGSREDARRRLIAALEDTLVLGVPTNISYLIGALRQRIFAAGKANTSFLERDLEAPGTDSVDTLMLAVGSILWFEATAAGNRGAPDAAPAEPWRSTGTAAWPLRLASGDAHHSVTVSVGSENRYTVIAADATAEIEVIAREPGRLRFASGGIRRTARYVFGGGALHLDLKGATATYRESLLEPDSRGDAAGDGRLLAPMNGRIVAVLARPGDTVTKGQRILVLEAMKMQQEIVAQQNGVLERVCVKAGDQVAARQVLAAIAAEEDGDPSNPEQG